ncbi:hypothetical protein D9M73_292250 [compost metagenome]
MRSCEKAITRYTSRAIMPVVFIRVSSTSFGRRVSLKLINAHTTATAHEPMIAYTGTPVPARVILKNDGASPRWARENSMREAV